MLEEIETPDRAEAWVTHALEQHIRIMGFGHAVYRTEDPRAAVLRQLSRELGERTGNMQWYDISVEVERLVFERKGLYPNVDFYSASVSHMLGIDTAIFTPLFACSRIAGWTAHVLEQYDNNRLMRPRAHYTGPATRSYVPIEQR
jgi:citrate synthase